MRTTTTATTTAPASCDVGATAPVFSECLAYSYAGEGRFLPANDAARLECARWNAYADVWNARTAARSAP